MSVQAGIWNVDGSPIDPSIVSSISTETAEYGPDNANIHVDDNIAMLYRAFHTTPESRLERQPHVLADGSVMTWDGRLDNRDDLIAQLGLHSTLPLTDLAIVAGAYEKWAELCFAKLIGDWALAIWKPGTQELLLSRDYIGVRHLYYFWRGTQLIWCTLLSPLALRGKSLTLCDEYVAGYLALHPDADLTPYKEIKAVLPGTFVRCCSQKTVVHRYWSFKRHCKTEHKSDVEYEEHFLEVFHQAVRRRLRTDSPILAELSGGFDSSSIVCIADVIVAQCSGQAPSIDTFSIYDSNDPSADDFNYFTAVENKRGRKGYHVDLGDSPVSFSLEQKGFVPTPGFGEREGLRPAVSRVVQQGKYRIGLSGIGGDELLGQALDPRVQLADLLVDLKLHDLSKQLVDWSLWMRRPWIQLLLETFRLLLPATIRARVTESARVEPWINSRFAKKYQIPSRRVAAMKESQFWRPTDRDCFDTIIALGRQMTYARPSIIEKRYPYLDQTLVEFVTSIPSSQLLRPRERRSLMKRSLAKVLPFEIASRRTKAAAGACHVLTLQTHWDKLENMFSAPLTSDYGYIERDEFYKALCQAKHGHVSPYFVRLLRVISFELWLRQAMNRGLIRPRGEEHQKHSQVLAPLPI